MILFLILILGVWILVSLPFYKVGYEGYYTSDLDEPRTKTNWNAIALFLNIRNGELKLPKRKFGIDKEIAEEEKEIAELERQKEKIDTLANLKRRKERLFHDVRDTPKREELNSDIAVSFSGNKNRLDVEFISGWHKVYYSHAYNLDEIKQAIYDGKPIIEEDVRL